MRGLALAATIAAVAVYFLKHDVIGAAVLFVAAALFLAAEISEGRR